MIVSFLGAALAAAGCGKNLSVRTIDVALDNFRGRDAFDPDYPDRLPYASMAVSMPNMKRGLVILGKAEGDELHWFTADRGVLVTRFGRVVRCVGFPDNLAKTGFIDPDFLDPAVALRDGAVCRRRLDFSPGNYFGALATARIHLRGSESLLIGKRQLVLSLIEEHATVAGLEWSFVNRYWVDEQRFVWRSEQQLSPGLPAMQIDVLKPYGNQST